MFAVCAFLVAKEILNIHEQRNNKQLKFSPQWPEAVISFRRSSYW